MRQKLVGWVLIVVSSAYLVYFLRLRLFEAGPPIIAKEWFQFITSAVVLMIGTANVRLAAMRSRQERE
jgi:chromate transport protein ChrA